ncbi:MAG: hypothetical protein JWQ64_43 [Subtercola sp.]|nr:hypothetical protein [Subtercola sp.]
MSAMTGFATAPDRPLVQRAGGDPRLPRRRVRPALAALLLSTAVLYGWNIANSGLSDYYATAAKSMSVSWRAFFYGAFDPSGTVTIDKLAGFLVPQALSARLFGFSPFALALPQVIEGVVTVGATYFIVSTWLGRRLGLLAGAIMAFTPLLVSMFSHAMEDGMLTMCTTLAVLAWQRSVVTGNARFLYLAAAFVGIGFQAKMMQSWLVLPPLFALYFLLAPHRLRARLRALLIAGAVVLIVSVLWMTVIQLVPAGSRPYIDGTSNDNIFSMVFGYNGLNRFSPGLVPGAIGIETVANSDPSGVSVAGNGLAALAINHTPLKFVLPVYATQIGWLLPLAAAGAILGGFELHRHRGRSVPRVLRARGVEAMWALGLSQLIVTGGVVSIITLPHTAYLASLALPLVLLNLVGILLLARAAHSSSRSMRLALPLTITAETVFIVALLSTYLPGSSILLGAVGVGGLIAAAVTFRSALSPDALDARRRVFVAASLALAVTLAAPITWSLSTIVPGWNGSPNDAYAGPATTTFAEKLQQRNPSYGIGLNSNRQSIDTAADEGAIYAFARTEPTRRMYALVTDSWRSAAPLILNGAVDVMPVGGYTGRLDALALDRVQLLVSAGDLRYVLLTGAASKSGTVTPAVTALGHWVRQNCTTVDPALYDSDTSTPAPWTLQTDELFDCQVSAAHNIQSTSRAEIINRISR